MHAILYKVKKDVEYWVNLANYDIETAQAMFKSGRFLYVLFTCQQAIEKLLKALIIQETEQFPPRIHDLVKLARLAKIEPGENQMQFIAKLSFYYIETRYPEQKNNLSKEINKENANLYLSKSDEVFNWLKTKIV